MKVNGILSPDIVSKAEPGPLGQDLLPSLPKEAFPRDKIRTLFLQTLRTFPDWLSPPSNDGGFAAPPTSVSVRYVLAHAF
jgi:hypothetical protein